MLIGCTIFYNDAPALLERCLKSTGAHVDKLVVVDGSFANFPHPAGDRSSTANHLELAAEYADELIECPPEGWSTEIDKRNRYLVGETGDWYLVVDSDEEVVDFPYRAEDLEATGARGFRLWLVEGDQPRRSVMRLFRQDEKVAYVGAHNAVRGGDGLLLNHRCDALSDALLRHYPHERAPERAEADAVYIPRLARREAAFRARHRL